MSYLCSVNKTGICGFLKILFLNGGVNAFILMGVGTCGFKKKNHFCVGCTFLLDFFGLFIVF